jgi:isoleucyl-tRNA synthetase
MCHGVVLDEKGEKLSKRLRNYPDPEEMFEKVGSDALRWFLIASPILRGGDLNIDKDGKGISEIVRTVINPIWNAFYFFTLYANTDGIKGEVNCSSKALLDRYILGKLQVLVADTTKYFDAYDLAASCNSILQFIDALNNWYIRRSRDRFWKADKDQDKTDAYNTLYTVLVTLCKVAAPVLPMLTEEIYRTLTGEESVHLASFPKVSDFPSEVELATTMDTVRAVCSSGLSLREAHNLRTRLPLSKITVAGNGLEKIAPYDFLIKDEINVKSVEFATDFSAFASYQLALNARAIGPRLGEKMKTLLASAKAGDWKFANDGKVSVEGEVLLETEYTLRLISKEGVAAISLSDRSGVVVLDTAVTAELESEGLARDFVRGVQQLRKEKGFHVADHIEVTVVAPEHIRNSLTTHQKYIEEQVLAKKFFFATDTTSNGKQLEFSKVPVTGAELQVGVVK